MKKTTLLLLSSSLAFAYAVAVSHVPANESSEEVACGGSDTKKKGDKKNEDDRT